MTNETLAATVLPTIDEIKDAQELVYAVMPPTPQFRWPLLCERLGAEVWAKHENHTPIGALKARTAATARRKTPLCGHRVAISSSLVATSRKRKSTRSNLRSSTGGTLCRPTIAT